MLWKRSGDGAVSEVVGNLLILLITVALFSVVLGFVYSIPGPEASLQAGSRYFFGPSFWT